MHKRAQNVNQKTRKVDVTRLSWFVSWRALAPTNFWFITKPAPNQPQSITSRLHMTIWASMNNEQ